MKNTLMTLCLAVFSLGCASAQIKKNPSATFPIAVSADAPVFLFPVNLSHLGSGGDPTLMGVTVTGGVINKFGKDVVSGQQLFDMVGNLSYELAEAIQSQANSEKWEMSGSAEKTATDLSTTMTTITGQLVDKKIVDKPINFKYIIAVHSHGTSTMGGTMLEVQSWGGIYEADTKKILAYIDSKDTFANKPEAVMGQLPSVYNGIIEKLIAGGEAAKK